MKCRQCGGKLKRVHRTFFERFGYMAVYECQKCEIEEFVPRRFRYHFDSFCRCPLCGSYRVVRLKRPDKIDRRHGGFLNLLERLISRGRMFHCRWCRLQFYDRRRVATQAEAGPPEVPPDPVAPADPVAPVVPEAAEARNTAGSTP
jgi:hypothetical protein